MSFFKKVINEAKETFEEIKEKVNEHKAEKENERGTSSYSGGTHYPNSGYPSADHHHGHHDSHSRGDESGYPVAEHPDERRGSRSPHQRRNCKESDSDDEENHSRHKHSPNCGKRDPRGKRYYEHQVGSDILLTRCMNV
jgi:hypothetical protein